MKGSSLPFEFTPRQRVKRDRLALARGSFVVARADSRFVAARAIPGGAHLTFPGGSGRNRGHLLPPGAPPLEVIARGSRIRNPERSRECNGVTPALRNAEIR